MKEHNYQFRHQKNGKTILVAPLHWGLGHATRCIPIIHALLNHGYQVLIGSDGGALDLLKKEFPELPYVELPAYKITYPKKGEFFKFKMFLNLPEIRKAIRDEKKLVAQYVEDNRIDGIISDNRLGVRNKKVPSVFVTHQVNVLSGNTSLFSSKMHQKIIKKYDACWVPDISGGINLSGKLGHPKKIKFPLHYMGPLSRMKKKEVPKEYDILALLSGPEPQRSLLEQKLIKEFTGSDKKVLLVRGIIESESKTTTVDTITITNFLQTEALEQALNASEVVVSRSGYTTIMDLAALEKPAFFIPTPGQFEQEYLAKELKKKGMVPSCKQDNFTLSKLNKVPFYSGLKNIAEEEIDFKELFALFKRE